MLCPCAEVDLESLYSPSYSPEFKEGQHKLSWGLEKQAV